MIRLLGALLLAGLALSACGSVSASTAMSNWTNKNTFLATTRTLRVDVAHSAAALENTSSAPDVLHTVCGVLLIDTQSANDDLPTPDVQTTTLLGRAYVNLGAAANTCYKAANDAALRAKALRFLSLGAGQLAEGTARVASVKAS